MRNYSQAPPRYVLSGSVVFFFTSRRRHASLRYLLETNMPAQTAEQHEQYEKLKKEVKSVFQLVELQTKDRRGQCDEREIPTIVRSLGLNPTQEQLRDIITELRGEDSMSGYVEYERFEKVMMRVLTEQQAGHGSSSSSTRFSRSANSFNCINHAC